MSGARDRGGPPDEAPEDGPLDEALLALDEGRPADALALLDELPADSGERWATAVYAFLDLADARGAERALAEARRLLGPEHRDVRWAEGRLCLARWDVRGARAALGALSVDDEGAPLLEELALLSDLEGDARTADKLFRRAAALDPDGSPAPPRLSPEDFEAVVAEAARELPAEFARALHDMAVVIDPMPTAEIVGAPGSGHTPDILGLFVGAPLAERARADPSELPPTIYLFQRNLERASLTRRELREEIRTTLYHELGHALGFDEEGVDELGLG